MYNKSKETGSATIEATISLTLFIFVIMAIYTLINFCIVQAKFSYALNTTAKEMSQYAYFYNALGADKLDSALAAKKKQAVDTFTNMGKLIDNAKTEISEISESPTNYFEEILIDSEENGKKEELNEVYQQIQAVSVNISDVVNDPGEFMKSLASIAGEKLWEKVKTNVIAAPLAKGMTRRHFGSNLTEANKLLTQLGVVDGYDGVNFNLSTLFEEEYPQDISLIIYYNLNLTSMFPFDLNITISQKATTRAWLGGDLNPKD